MENQYKKMKKRIIIISLVIVCLLTIIVILSPYRSYEGYPYRLIKHTVEINAPVKTVFDFLGNSKNASRWSVFVHHIITLNADEVADGKPGSRRRCFCNADEKGTQWDELITEVIPNHKRQLTIYNLKEFPMTAKNLATEQLYEAVGENRCRLTFTVFFKDAEPTLMEKIKLYIGSYKIKSIFKQNMENIKTIVEKEKNG